MTRQIYLAMVEVIHPSMAARANGTVGVAELEPLRSDPMAPILVAKAELVVLVEMVKLARLLMH